MKKQVIILFHILIFGAITGYSQKNAGFELGLAGWQISGEKSGINLDSMNVLQGKYCARMGRNTGISQRINVSPFSVLQFNIYLKCSNLKTVAHSFIRFYNNKDLELLEYKSGPISTEKYVETGDYTEAPPFTKYALIGIERDSTPGYAYTDSLSLELNIGQPPVRQKPVCNLNKYMKPFWKGDTVYDETVLLYAENGQPASGRLLYEPTSILSVKSFDLKTEYKKGLDYSIKNNILTRLAGSKMTFLSDTSFDRKKDLSWFNIQSKWVVVSYTHKEKWNQVIPGFKGALLPKTLSKLQSGSPLKILAYGMSITRGLDVSSYDAVSPYMPNYIDLFARELKKMYGYEAITMYNAGLPGALVSWAADYAEKYINPLKPDLVIIDFGMNDFWRYSPEEFKGYIETIIKKVEKGNPATEFLLLSNMDFDPDYILDSDGNKAFYLNNMQGYKRVLKEMEKKGIINLDMTSLSDLIYQKKKAKDCIANPLHPNDYLSRWYAQAMSALFLKQTP